MKAQRGPQLQRKCRRGPVAPGAATAREQFSLLSWAKERAPAAAPKVERAALEATHLKQRFRPPDLLGSGVCIHRSLVSDMPFQKTGGMHPVGGERHCGRALKWRRPRQKRASRHTSRRKFKARAKKALSQGVA